MKAMRTIAILFSLTLAACASTSVKNQWRDPHERNHVEVVLRHCPAARAAEDDRHDNRRECERAQQDFLLQR